jgi:hypothetical protein
MPGRCRSKRRRGPSGLLTYASRGVEGKVGDEEARENLPLDADDPEGRGVDGGGARARRGERRRARRRAIGCMSIFTAK